mgnify:CR=1 FL=1
MLFEVFLQAAGDLGGQHGILGRVGSLYQQVRYVIVLLVAGGHAIGEVLFQHHLVYLVQHLAGFFFLVLNGQVERSRGVGHADGIQVTAVLFVEINAGFIGIAAGEFGHHHVVHTLVVYFAFEYRNEAVAQTILADVFLEAESPTIL